MCLAFRHRLLVLVAGVLATALACWFFALPAYRHFKEIRAVARAQACFAFGDLRNANLSARQALAIDSTNLDACLLMAQMAEAVRAPQALDWRKRIADLSPTLEHKLAVAQTALGLRSVPIATQALKEVAPLADKSPEYHTLAAQLALKLTHLDEAELHFASAARLQPDNPLHRLNLSVVQLLSTNQAIADSARATLKSLTENTNVAAIALRSLAADALKNKQFTNAELFSKSLLDDSRATFSDKLQHLAILREAAWPEFEPTLITLQRNVITNALTAWSLANWMNRNGLASRTLEWLTNSPATLQTNAPVPLAMADSYIECGNWPGLEAFLQPQNWSELDFARLALLGRAAAAQQNQVAAVAYWRLAIRQAGARLGPLTSLLTLAGDWNLPEIRQILLAQIVEKFPRERWAYRELVPIYASAGNTRAINRISGFLASTDPQDIEARNDFAATSLLLKINTAQAHRQAKENVARRPDDPILVATYAYSLHLQGRTGEGLAALRGLKAESLSEPSTALYYGLLLGAAHQSNKARTVLTVVEPARLLPEERQLLSELEQKQ